MIRERFNEALVFFIVACVAGTLLEWLYGHFWDLVGTAPWLKRPTRNRLLKRTPAVTIWTPCWPN